MNLASCLSAYPLVMWSGLGRGQELPIGKVGWSSDGYLEGNFHIFFFENPGFFHEITIWKFIIVNSSIFKVFSDVSTILQQQDLDLDLCHYKVAGDASSLGL